MRKIGLGKNPRTAVLAAIVVIGILAAWIVGTFSVGSSTVELSPKRAVAISLEFAKSDGRPAPSFAGLVGGPTSVKGSIVTLDTAKYIKSGRHINPKSLEWERKDNLVWLTVFSGNVDASRQVKGQVQPTSVEYNQTTIIMDAKTGRLIYRSAHPVGQERDTSGLDDLTSFLPEPQ